MSEVTPISPRVGIAGAVICSLIIAFEFAAGFHLRGLTLNLALGLAWSLILVFALVSYRLKGLWVLLGAALALVLIANPGFQLIVGCSVNVQNCP